MDTILVTAIGSFSSSEVISKLKGAGYRVIGCDIYDRKWLANSNEVDNFYQAPYANKKDDYIKFVLQVCEKEKVKYVIPLTDIEVDVLNSYRREFEARGLIVCISSFETINICRDKLETYHFLRNRGVNCLIRTELLKDVDENVFAFPLVIKPYNGRSSEGLHFVESREKFMSLKNTDFTNDMIVQEKVEGSVVTVDVCRNPLTGTIVCIPRLELLRTHNGAGTSVQILNDERIIELSREIATVLNVCGTVNFEFLKSGNKYYFLECNPRYSGGVAFSGVAGYDFVNNAMKCFMGKEIDPQIKMQQKYIVKKYIEVVTE